MAKKKEPEAVYLRSDRVTIPASSLNRLLKRENKSIAAAKGARDERAKAQAVRNAKLVQLGKNAKNLLETTSKNAIAKQTQLLYDTWKYDEKYGPIGVRQSPIWYTPLAARDSQNKTSSKELMG